MKNVLGVGIIIILICAVIATKDEKPKTINVTSPKQWVIKDVRVYYNENGEMMEPKPRVKVLDHEPTHQDSVDFEILYE